MARKPSTSGRYAIDCVPWEVLGSAVVDHYVHTARWEQLEYDRRITDWELMRGFERY